MRLVLVLDRLVALLDLGGDLVPGLRADLVREHDVPALAGQLLHQRRVVDRRQPRRQYAGQLAGDLAGLSRVGGDRDRVLRHRQRDAVAVQDRAARGVQDERLGVLLGRGQRVAVRVDALENDQPPGEQRQHQRHHAERHPEPQRRAPELQQSRRLLHPRLAAGGAASAAAASAARQPSWPAAARQVLLRLGRGRPSGPTRRAPSARLARPAGRRLLRGPARRLRAVAPELAAGLSRRAAARAVAPSAGRVSAVVRGAPVAAACGARLLRRPGRAAGTLCSGTTALGSGATGRRSLAGRVSPARFTTAFAWWLVSPSFRHPIIPRSVCWSLCWCSSAAWCWPAASPA